MRDKFKSYIVDAVALMLFSTALGAFAEIAISGMSLRQSMAVRLSAAPISLLVGRPYGLYRDRLFTWFQATEDARWKAAAVDTLASVTFQMPLYILLLWFAGARLDQMGYAVATVLLLNLISGRPYGLFLLWCRRCFGVGKRASGASRRRASVSSCEVGTDNPPGELPKLF